MMFGDDDDGVEPQIKAVDEYYFEVTKESKLGKDEPICFSILPFQFNENDKVDNSDFEKKVYLRGIVDKSLYRLHKEVVSWRLGQLDCGQPSISVLSSEGNWIELLNPRKCYKEEVARSILITIQMIHFVKKHHRNRRSLWDCLWDHLNEVFVELDPKPTMDDLRNHHSLIKLLRQRDSTLMKLKIMHRFNLDTTETTKKPKTPATKVDFIDNDVSWTRDNDSGSGYDGYDNDDDSDYDRSDDPDYDIYDDPDYTIDKDNCNEYDTCVEDDNSNDGNDTLCALCDDGGELISCIGQCKRSFHPRIKDGKESKCKTLGYTSKELKEISSFLCKNCEYKQQQCFKCGELEPSAEPNAKVFKCNNPSCGHFYHPKCVAKLLEPDDSNGDGSYELEKRIMEGMSFTCPMHWCFGCGRAENKTQRATQFAMCRRCPKSYHIECLPREISFEAKDKNTEQRAWSLPGNVIIYCLDHKICRATGNAKRDHIKFPQTPKIIEVQDLAKQKGKMVSKRKRSVDQCSMKSIKALTKLPKEKIGHTENSLQHMVLRLDDSTSSLKEDLQIEPSMVEATNQSSQITLKWQKKQPRSPMSFVMRSRMPSSDVGSKSKKRKTSRPKKERSSRKSDNIVKNCVDHPIQDNLLEDPPTYKDTELDNVTGKITNDKDGRKENSSVHLGEEDGTTHEDTFPENNEGNDVSGKLFMDLYAKLDDNKLKSRVEISIQLGENVDSHDSITGRDKDISMEDNQMSQSMFEQESVSVKSKTATNSSGSNGGFAPYHIGGNPPEMLLHVLDVGNMVIINRIHSQPQYTYDKVQEVNQEHTFQDDPESFQCNVIPNEMGIDTSSDKSRKKIELKEKATDGNKMGLDDTIRCNEIKDGKEAHCDHSSHQCPLDHKEPDYRDHNSGSTGLGGSQCNDENKVAGISKYIEQSTGSSRRENLMNDTTENSSNPIVGTHSHMEQRNHSLNRQRTYYDRYEQHHPINNQHRYGQYHDVNYSSNGNYGPRSDVPLRPILSPTEFDDNRRHDPYSYPREFLHDITRCNNPYFHPRSPGYFIGGWHSTPCYPTRPMHVDYAQNANNFPIHGYDARNNFMHVGYNARGIAPTTIYPPLQLNNNGAYQPHTHVRMQGHGTTYGGHNKEYGVRSQYTLSLGPHPQATRSSVMDKYAPNLEQTNNQARS